jgi:hypothetical protein
MSRPKGSQRYRCPYCKKSWLATAYDYGSHTLRCSLGPHVTTHPAEGEARKTGAYRGYQLFATRVGGRRPGHWRAQKAGFALDASSLPALLALLDVRHGNKLAPRVVSKNGGDR